MAWSLKDILDATQGTPVQITDERFSAISTDSRTIAATELFVPIVGDTFDGHRFISDTMKQKGVGALCQRGRVGSLKGVTGTLIAVDDTQKALLDLARFWRQRLTGTVIAITGSNGKTTTKELLVHILKGNRSVAFNEKNFNNLIGVPKSILGIEGDPQVCVFELGTNRPGEIATLTTVTEPEISLITNVNPSHLEGLTDIEGVLREKTDLFNHTRKGGTIVINADDPRILSYQNNRSHIVRTFGMENDADYRLIIDEHRGWEGYGMTIRTPDGTFRAGTRLLGRHNLMNILAAAVLAHAVGIPATTIASAIETFLPYGRRFEPIRSDRGYVIIDDCYNANPSSMEWALRTLEELPCAGKRIAVLGDMKELGDGMSHYHRELGKFLAAARIPVIVLTGDAMHEAFEEARKAGACHFTSKADLVEYVRKTATAGDTILIKGSRAEKMEEIVEALQ